MTSEKRDWRDAKIPQWVKDSIADDLHEWKLTAALAWPKEAKPAPVPFSWGDYDRPIGSPVAGIYWSANGKARKVEIREKTAEDTGCKPWRFNEDGRGWSSNVVHGPLFSSERDATLYLLWSACEECARKLMGYQL
jgi:hypothetical protein